MPVLNFSPFPVLNTPRLVMRQLHPADAQAIFDLRRDEIVNKLVGRKTATDIAEAVSFIENRNRDIAANNSLYWAVCLKEQTNLAGTFCLFHFEQENTIAEIGYEFLPSYRGRGLAREALESIIDYSFNTLQLNKLVAYVHGENILSLRLLQAHGFILVPERKDAHNANNLILEKLNSNRGL